jgi:hypothetical protein
VGAQYIWSGPNGFGATIQNPVLPNIPTAAAGVYSLVVVQGGCTSRVATTQLTMRPTPNALQVSPVAPLCEGDQARLIASEAPNATYFWSGPSGFTSSLRQVTLQNVRVNMAGNYQVVAIVEGCTSAPTSVQVAINPKPAISAVGANSPVCQGASLYLTASLIPGASYQWSGPRFTSSEPLPVLENTRLEQSGTYFVTASIGGCVSEAQAINVQINPAPQNVVAGNNGPLCVGQADLQLTASFVPGASYAWAGPGGYFSSEQNPTLTNPTTANSGSYTVTVSLGACTATASTEAMIGQVPQTITAGSNSPICEGQTLALTAETVFGGRYMWAGPNNFTANVANPTLADIRLANAGLYSVAVIVGNCTSATATVRVQVNPAPIGVTVGNSGPVCSGQTLSLYVTPIPGAIYNWSGPNGFASTLQNPSISGVTSANAGAYQVLARIGNCPGTPLVTQVTINPTPSGLFATNSSPACVGNKVQLWASSIPGASYAWLGPNGYSSSEQNPEILNIGTAQAGTYSVVARLGNCSSLVSPTTVVVRDFNMQLTAGSNGPLCEGDTLRLQGPELGGNATYLWRGPQGFSATTAQAAIPLVSFADSGSYSLTVTMNGCPSQTLTTRVAVRKAPVMPEVYTNAPICVGESIRLTAIAEAGALYSWSGPNRFSGTQASIVLTRATSLEAGVYTLRSMKDGCYSQPANIYVHVHHPQAEFITSAQTVCTGYAAQFDLNLTGDGPWNLSYLENGQTRLLTVGASPYVVPAMLQQNTSYRLLSVSDANGCEFPLTSTKEIRLAPLPQASIPATLKVCPGGQVQVPVTVTEASAGTPWLITYRLGNGPVQSLSGVGNGAFNLNAGVINAPLVLSLMSIENTADNCRRELNGAGSVTSIQLYTLPSAGFISPDRVICNGTESSITIGLTGNGPWTVEYTENGQLRTMTASSQPLHLTVAPTATTTYALRSVSDASGCLSAASGEVVIEVRQRPGFTLDAAQTEICSGDTSRVGYSLSGAGPWVLEYAQANINQSPIIIGNIGDSFYRGQMALAPWETTDYTFLRVTDANGCRAELNENLSVAVNAVPQLRLVASTATACHSGSLLVSASGGVKGTYVYRLGTLENTTGEFNGLAPGLYHISVTDGVCLSASFPAVISQAEAPAIISLQATENNAIVATWEPVFGVASYSVRYRSVGQSQWQTLETPINTITLDGLQSNVSYEVEVRYNCSGGSSSPWRNSGTVTTPNASACLTPSNVGVAILSNQNAQVSWQASLGAICYVVSWGKANEPMSAWVSRLVPAPSSSFQITDLEPGKEYGVRVRSNCTQCGLAAGNLSEWSAVRNWSVPASKFSAEGEEALSFRVYPNPTQGVFHFGYDLPAGQEATIQLTDMLGRLWFGKKLAGEATPGLLEIDISHIPAGAYLIHYEQGSRRRTLKLIKQ